MKRSKRIRETKRHIRAARRHLDEALEIVPNGEIADRVIELIDDFISASANVMIEIGRERTLRASIIGPNERTQY